MAEKRVSVRLAAVGGRQVRSELEGVGEAGKRGFGRLSQEMEAANRRLAGFARRVRVASAAAVAAATAAGVAMVRSGLQTVDAQAKLAQSLGTTVASIQTLERAGELAGVSMSGIEQATKDLTRRLSQAAAGTGPAADALDRLGLSATDLIALPLDQRVGAINAAIEDFVPAAERAAVAGQLFGEEGSIAMSRIDSATLRQATEDVRAFGVVVSEQDAAQIERTNDAISRLGLVWRGLSNQLAIAAAPALDGADALTEATGAAERLETALGEAGRAATGAGAAAGAAASAAEPNVETAVTGWQSVTAALSDYATKARNIGGDIGQSLVGAFRSAETAVAQFVKTGKLDFRDLVTSLLADLAKLAARRFILGPIANALSGALGGLGGKAGGIFADVLHAGGLVGAAGPARRVPAMAFTDAPRLHAGGMAGLKPDEVPAILQRGERVLSRRETRDFEAPRGDRAAPPVVNVTIQTRDAESFRQSRTQVASDIARAVAMGRRGM